MFVIEHDRSSNFMGLRTEFMSEAFVHFKDITHSRSKNDIDTLPQIKLNMTVPKSLGTEFAKKLCFVFYRVFIINNTLIPFYVRFKHFKSSRQKN